MRSATLPGSDPTRQAPVGTTMDTRSPVGLEGSCNCGGVRFEASKTLTTPTACHCVPCRRQSGHFFASTNGRKAGVRLQGAEHLRGYPSAPTIGRGFCARCGCPLSRKPTDRDWTSVAPGAREGPTGHRLERQIVVADKGDHDDLADGLPQDEHQAFPPHPPKDASP